MDIVAAPSRLLHALYKGTVDIPAKLLERVRVEGREEYLRLFQAAAETNPPFAQNVARAGGLVLAGLDMKLAGCEGRLIGGDGCPQNAGEWKKGAEIMAMIWRNVMPEELMKDLPPAQVQWESTCTWNEIRAVCQHKRSSDESILASTHAYHLPRVQSMYIEQGESGNVLTPEEILGKCPLMQPPEKFVAELIRIATPSDDLDRRERRKESFIYRPLHVVSRIGERLTGGRFSLEEWIAEKLRR